MMNEDQKELEELLDELVKGGAGNIVADPDTIKKLQEKGLPITERFVPYEEYFEDLVKKKSNNALERLRKLPTIDKRVADGVVSEIYEEIRSSFALGFFTSTIFNSILLLEYSMRVALYNKRLKDDPNTSWSELEEKQMRKLIELLRKAKLITKEEKAQLTDFSETMRNPYLHINIKKMTEGIVISELPGVDVKTKEKIKLTNVKTSEHRFLWFGAKRFFDKYHVEPTINYCVGWSNRFLTVQINDSPEPQTD